MFSPEPQSRRGFLGTTLLSAAATVSASALLRPAIAAAQAQTVPSTASQAANVSELDALRAVLDAAGKPTHVIENPDGTKVLILPYGGRVLGLFAPDGGQNFYWTHPALASADQAKAFYASQDWHNSGGDRTWLAPEVDIFLPNYPKTEGYFQPRELDPGNYQPLPSSSNDLKIANELTLRLSRSQRQVRLRITKSFGQAPDPLRREKTGYSGTPLTYAGYTQFTSLEILAEKPAGEPMIGLWNLVQMPHGGELLIPTYAKTTPRIWFGSISPEDLTVTEHLIRYRMRATGEHKMGVRAVATTGRVGYIHRNGEESTLIVRNFTVNPSGEYVDVPWADPEDFGYSTQACNVNSALGAFSELEYHIPAIGGRTGLGRCDDAAQVWAYRGPHEDILKAAHCLITPEV